MDGQWCSTSDQLSALGGSGPSLGSVADPAKVIVSPTFQVVPVPGLVIVAVGARSGVDRHRCAAVAPWLSVTCRLAAYVPSAVYVYVGVAESASS